MLGKTSVQVSTAHTPSFALVLSNHEDTLHKNKSNSGADEPDPKCSWVCRILPLGSGNQGSEKTDIANVVGGKFRGTQIFNILKQRLLPNWVQIILQYGMVSIWCLVFAFRKLEIIIVFLAILRIQFSLGQPYFSWGKNGYLLGNIKTGTCESCESTSSTVDQKNQARPETVRTDENANIEKSKHL